MPWTALSDFVDEQIVGDTELNALLGVSGNMAYLKAICDTPMKIQKDGVLVGTRQAFNLVTGSNVVLTVADDSGNNRVNATIAAAGGSSPTLGTDVSVETSLSDPLSYPAWSEWVALITAIAAESMYLQIATKVGNGTYVKRWQIGVGSSPVEKLDFYGSGTSTVFQPQIFPFKTDISSKLWARAYFEGTTTAVIRVMVES